MLPVKPFGLFLEGQIYEVAELGRNLVAESAESFEALFCRALHGERILQAPLKTSQCKRKNRVAFFGFVAEFHYIGEAFLKSCAHVFSYLMGNVDSNFFHGVNGERVERGGFHGSTDGLERVLCQGAQESFCHLAAFGVTGAKEKDSWLVPHASLQGGWAPPFSRAERFRAGNDASVLRREMQEAVDPSQTAVPAGYHPPRPTAPAWDNIHASAGWDTSGHKGLPRPDSALNRMTATIL